MGEDAYEPGRATRAVLDAMPVQNGKVLHGDRGMKNANGSTWQRWAMGIMAGAIIAGLTAFVTHVSAAGHDGCLRELDRLMGWTSRVDNRLSRIEKQLTLLIADAGLAEVESETGGSP